MRYKPGSHADDEVLEQYSIGSLAEPETEDFEEHLLVCSRCQDRLTETDRYVQAMRAASREVEGGAAASPGPKRSLIRALAQPGPALALAAVLIVSVIAGMRLWPPGGGAPLAVALESHRSATARSVPPGRRLNLHLDAVGLPALPAYTVQVVKASGGRVFEGPGQRTADTIAVPQSPSFAEGRYWVRVYDSSRTLLREYDLTVGGASVR